MSRPESETLPKSGRSCPLRRLKQVDLPAPFGPINANSSPGPSSKGTPATACTPPKDFVRFLTDRRDIRAVVRGSWFVGSVGALREPAECASDPSRKREHQEQNHPTQHDSPILRRAHD